MQRKRLLSYVGNKHYVGKENNYMIELEETLGKEPVVVKDTKEQKNDKNITKDNKPVKK